MTRSDVQAIFTTSNRYTDLHTHILPGFDDGVRDWDEAASLAKNAAKSGAVRIVATPHVMRGVYWPSPSDIKAKVQELSTRLQDAGLSLELIPGSEVYLASGLALEYRAGRLQPIGESGYLLVELPALNLPVYCFRELSDLRAAGAGVILAHPERNRELCRRRETIRELADSGTLFQVNAGSYAGVYGTQARECAEHIFREGLAHFIGSDAHSGQPASVSDVGGDISEALRRISGLGPEGERFLSAVEARTARLLAGKL